MNGTAIATDTAVVDDAPARCSQANFARLIGCDKSYITKLKGEGRLVLGEDGQVEVAASLARIKATTGAPERAAPAVQGSDYQDAADRDKHYSAELKRLEYEREIKSVFEAADVLNIVADAATTLRGRFEAWPDRLSLRLVALGADEHRIRALLAEEVQAAFEEMARNFERIASMGKGT